LRQALTALAILVMLLVNALANILPINGQTTAAVSDSLPVLFVPAGYVFSIWGLIYLGLIAFAVYQALPAQATNPILQRIGPLVIANAVANSIWIFFWHYELFPLTVLAMAVVLGTLIAIYLRLDRHRAGITNAWRWCVQVPFSIYLGWISVATVANVSGALYWAGWNGGGIDPQIWTAVLLAVAAGLAVAMAVRERDIAFGGVILWAFVGIMIKQAGAPLVAGSAGVLGGLVLLVLVATLLRRTSRRIALRAGTA
jgi:hypothetical protein